MVELRHLRYFTAVAEAWRHRRHCANPSCGTVGYQRADSRSRIGIRRLSLFDRKNRRIRLTYHGEQFLKDAREVLAAADRSVANVQKSTRGEIGTLTIGFFIGGTGTFFSGLIKEFRHRFRRCSSRWWRWRLPCSIAHWRRAPSISRSPVPCNRPTQRSSARSISRRNRFTR